MWIESIESGVPIWHTPAMKQIEVHIDREMSSFLYQNMIWIDYQQVYICILLELSLIRNPQTLMRIVVNLVYCDHKHVLNAWCKQMNEDNAHVTVYGQLTETIFFCNISSILWFVKIVINIGF